MTDPWGAASGRFSLWVISKGCLPRLIIGYVVESMKIDVILVGHCKCSFILYIFELFDVQNIMTLKSRLGVIEGHWK